jgi:hypothetical protein
MCLEDTEVSSGNQPDQALICGMVSAMLMTSLWLLRGGKFYLLGTWSSGRCVAGMLTLAVWAACAVVLCDELRIEVRRML